MTAYLDLADYLLIAEEVLGAPAETIAGWPGIGLAESALNAPRGLEMPLLTAPDSPLVFVRRLSSLVERRKRVVLAEEGRGRGGHDRRPPRPAPSQGRR